MSVSEAMQRFWARVEGEQRALHAADLVAHPTVVERSPARYASRVMRCIAREMPAHAAALERCAAILDT
jgi:hypothetical protein